MTEPAAAAETFNIGRVFDVLDRAFKAKGWPLLALALLLVGLPQAAYLSADVTGLSQEATSAVAIGISIVTTLVFQGAVIDAVLAISAGMERSIWASLGVGFKKFWLLLAISLLSGVVIGLGLVVLIFPGLYLATVWLLALPAALDRRPGVVASLERSAMLTKKHRWWVFLLLVVVVAATGGGLLIDEFIYLSGSVWLGALSTLITSSLSGLITAGLPAAAYVELCRIKEGDSAKRLAAVFE